MAETPSPVQIRVHAPERRRRFPTQGVLACSTCCCCCLHTVGSLLLSSMAARDLPPEPRPSRGPSGRAADPSVLHEVLGDYYFFRVADEAARAGELSGPAFETIGREMRARVDRIWSGLFPGSDPEGYAWTIERLPMLAAEGALPQEAVGSLLDDLTPLAYGAPRERQRGALAGLWHLHFLYRVLDERVTAGRLPASVLPPVRDALHRRVSATAQGLRGDGFPAPAIEKARALVESLAGKLNSQELQRLAFRFGPSDPAGPNLGPVAVSASKALCAVCGQALAGSPSVACASCETPHHQDCWDYNKRCAMFACGCADVLGPEGLPARALRYRFEPAPVAKKGAIKSGVVESARRRAASTYWLYVGLLTVALGLYFTATSNLLVAGILLALWMPVLQLGASAAAAITIAVAGGEGESAALGQVGSMTKGCMAGAVMGIAAMFLLFVVLSAL